MTIDPKAIPQVAVTFINQDHAEEARLIDAVEQALADLRRGEPAAAVLERLAALAAHTRDHFAREEEAMEQTGFPPLPIHRAEHQRVLAELAAEQRHFASTGDGARLGAYVTGVVPDWFTRHILTMDTMTARFLAQRGY